MFFTYIDSLAVNAKEEEKEKGQVGERGIRVGGRGTGEKCLVGFLLL